MDALSKVGNAGGSAEDYIKTIDSFLAASDENSLRDTVLYRTPRKMPHSTPSPGLPPDTHTPTF